MYLSKDALKKLLMLVALSLINLAHAVIPDFVYSWLDKLPPAKINFQVGAFSAANLGKAQHINIQTLQGDYFSVRKNRDQNSFVGLGYYLQGNEYANLNWQYGLGAFYFMESTVKGRVTQENLFTNLAYSYDITNLPIYAATKGRFDLANPKHHIIFDLGIGPNIKQTANFKEKSLDGGVTVPDQIFKGMTTVNFSAMTGLAMKFDKVLDQASLECGYHIFYLGRGSLNKTNRLVLNSLKTGNNYAHAVSCGILL